MIDVKLVDSDTTPMSTPNSSRAGSDDEVLIIDVFTSDSD